LLALIEKCEERTSETFLKNLEDIFFRILNSAEREEKKELKKVDARPFLSPTPLYFLFHTELYFKDLRQVS